MLLPEVDVGRALRAAQGGDRPAAAAFPTGMRIGFDAAKTRAASTAPTGRGAGHAGHARGAATTRRRARMKSSTSAPSSFPLLKTGGLADVSGAPAAGAARRRAATCGCCCRASRPIVRASARAEPACTRAQLALPPRRAGPRPTGWPRRRCCSRPRCRAAACRPMCWTRRALFDRPGNPYHDGGQPWPTTPCASPAGLGRRAAGPRAGPHWQPDIVHCHDWHAGLARLPAPAGGRGPPRARRPCSPSTTWPTRALSRARCSRELGLPDYLFGIEGLEFYGQVSFMKAGLQYADRITTVSPTYAREIQGRSRAAGSTALLRARRGAAVAASSTASTTTSGARPPTRSCRTRYDADNLQRQGAAKAGCSAGLGLEAAPGRAAVRRGQPPDRAEGPAPAARPSPTSWWHRAASWPCWARATPPMEQAFRRAAAAAPRRRSACTSATTKRWPTP